MAQIRVFTTKDNVKMSSLGLRWCKKDCRWERNGVMSAELSKELKRLKESKEIDDYHQKW